MRRHAEARPPSPQAAAALERVLKCDRRTARHRQAILDIADERAEAITAAVAAYGRGGRLWLAAEMGVTPGVVDAALQRVKRRGRSAPSRKDQQ